MNTSSSIAIQSIHTFRSQRDFQDMASNSRACLEKRSLNSHLEGLLLYLSTSSPADALGFATAFIVDEEW